MKNNGSIKLVKSAVRTMELFSVFADARRPLSLGELAEGMGAPRSSVYELIQTLVHLRYILVIEEGKSYYPSRRLYDIAGQIYAFNPIKEKVQKELRRLRDKTGETVVIGRLQGDQVIYDEVFDGVHTIRYTARSGDLKSVHASALGKALLGALEEGVRQDLIRGLELTRFNDRTIGTEAALQANLEQCRREGVYTTEGEHMADVMGIAAPVNIQGHQLAVGMAGPIPRMRDNLASYTRALMEAVSRITR